MTRITRISLWHLPLISHETYYMASGKTCDTVETVVLALDTDDGRTGWGEVCPIPQYLAAYARGVAPAVTEMARIAREARKQGIAQFQVKLGVEGDWQADVARLRRVRETVGEGPLVHGDWNCDATSLDAARVGRAFAAHDIMLEQPCATIDECARVRQATGLPMKPDEVVHDTASLLDAHAKGCMDAVAIKLSKFGGLSAARQARDLCLCLGARMCIEDTWGSDIATAAALHLGAATDPARLLNVCDLSGYVAPRLAPDCPMRENGHIAPPDGLGLGISPDRAALGLPDVVLD